MTTKPVLKLVRGAAAPLPQVRELDWSILMARAQDGDANAYRRLLEGITPYLRAHAARCHRNPSDVEDAIQDILLTLHAARATYDPARPFAPWLTAIARRRLIDRLRRQGRRRAFETEFELAHEAFAGQPTNLEDMTNIHEIATALDRLPPGQREAVLLTKIEGLSLKEASAASGMSVAALKVATHRAVQRLRRFFSGGSEP
ncbi:sigma-70 family RNA polymerase sigma factor [Mesorhizobium sp. M1C.F.Ca.ET.193.01.1.1]|uniref:sigma-70 family RNA polymerase sigma factor n=1 Tax=unclassified Mesorhizobium TaxID=325217 RepID=UPI000FD47EB9|nr:MULTISPECIES: sigma-70 family RNA polymerase sigma factor [unclassified Mesorhizobium]TGS97139.1 sigma-70 family RNA polymerase sigma factor [bacterium M00.F.Ca.ET.177.01.1.1]TGQ52300.1 sigma-70 family RNA polymerase sigma factor [Mesorhizobium sp. M1C.F.Ca.ET.210.01.1.1]TGQ68930.1 sigma-70 family RNA polymerase sigma factor [Mesorhizobium sp. M1C.F.Ca.ET.212.01.1.1]TGR04483.1 sigma-70 family RNA polymerase sigma factor [Mesorhizobium sp. M1C.F.Ca.ET.204.01.1.1]TGR25250.1 sigma-70 family RN